ncbi:transposon Ty3-I Gag-Pol poly [Labeo rohita]|uniref:Transposon Ty3-I Gag-Pol poly n=1 Tax=Labeo rohita TaxID=84645 RepID=A0A498LQT4_LABRO|nr:transposon Ty3-I Gag-Pol poly [Labeo rohita]
MQRKDKSSKKAKESKMKWDTDRFRNRYLQSYLNSCFDWISTFNASISNNNPLAHLNTANLGAVEQRWAAQLAGFQFEVRYRPGRTNGNADALSRWPLLRMWRRVTSSRQWYIQIKEIRLAPVCWLSGREHSGLIQRYHDCGSIWTEGEGPLQGSEQRKIDLLKCCCDSGPVSVLIRDCCAGRTSGGGKDFEFGPSPILLAKVGTRSGEVVPAMCSMQLAQDSCK